MTDSQHLQLDLFGDGKLAVAEYLKVTLQNINPDISQVNLGEHPKAEEKRLTFKFF